MDAWSFIGDAFHLAVTVIGAVVSGLALSAWNSWRKDQQETAESIQTLHTNHSVLANDLVRHGRDIERLQGEHVALDRRFQKHEQKHVRLETIVESMKGSHPRIHPKED